MSLAHNAISQVHLAMQRHAEARAIDQAQLHYTAYLLCHWAIVDACLIACILAESRGDEWPEFPQVPQRLRLDYLQPSHPQSLYANIGRRLKAFARSRWT